MDVVKVEDSLCTLSMGNVVTASTDSELVLFQYVYVAALTLLPRPSTSYQIHNYQSSLFQSSGLNGHGHEQETLGTMGPDGEVGLNAPHHQTI